MTTNGLHDFLQSSYNKYHSTETALTCIHDDILRAVDEKQCVILLLLDLSAAFDTIDHAMLLSRLQKYIGPRDTQGVYSGGVWVGMLHGWYIPQNSTSYALVEKQGSKLYIGQIAGKMGGQNYTFDKLLKNMGVDPIHPRRDTIKV